MFSRLFPVSQLREKPDKLHEWMHVLAAFLKGDSERKKDTASMHLSHCQDRDTLFKIGGKYIQDIISLATVYTPFK